MRPAALKYARGASGKLCLTNTATQGVYLMVERKRPYPAFVDFYWMHPPDGYSLPKIGYGLVHDGLVLVDFAWYDQFAKRSFLHGLDHRYDYSRSSVHNFIREMEL